MVIVLAESSSLEAPDEMIPYDIEDNNDLLMAACRMLRGFDDLGKSSGGSLK